MFGLFIGKLTYQRWYNNMDDIILLVNEHCLSDDLYYHKNLDFCDGWFGINKTDACNGNGLVHKYIWSENKTDYYLLGCENNGYK